MKSYAVCRKHAGDALAAMVGLENVAIRDVSNLDSTPGGVTYNCHCKKSADFFLIERRPRRE